jgi:hypothetical protein
LSARATGRPGQVRSGLVLRASRATRPDHANCRCAIRLVTPGTLGREAASCARACVCVCVCDIIGLLYRGHDVESDKAIFQIILQIGQALNGPFVMHVFEPGRQAAAEMSCAGRQAAAEMSCAGRQAAAEMSCAELSWRRSVCTVLCSDTAAALPRRARGGGRRSSPALRLARQTARRLGAWALGLEARRWPRRRPSEGIVSTMEGAVCACERACVMRAHSAAASPRRDGDKRTAARRSCAL